MKTKNTTTGSGAKLKVKRWSIVEAAPEFNINPKTLSKRIKVAGIEPGNDSCYSTAQICAAVFGDIDGERLRLTRAQADEKELANAETRKELVRFADLLEIAHRALSAMTTTVMGMTHLTVEDREAIINQLRAAGETVEHGDGSRATPAEVLG